MSTRENIRLIARAPYHPVSKGYGICDAINYILGLVGENITHALLKPWP